MGYSRGVRVGDRVVLAGTAPQWPDGTVDPDVGAQARRCFEIIGAALAEAGATFGDVVRTRVDYAAGQAAAARCLALALPAGVTTALSERAGLRGDVRLVVGRDWPARLVEGAETHAGL